MNLVELKNYVDRIYERNKDPENCKVGIKVFREGAIGGTPIAEVKSINSGIDWDRGKIIIYADCSLREIDLDEQKKLRKESEELGWKMYEISNLKKEIKDLKKQLNKG